MKITLKDQFNGFGLYLISQIYRTTCRLEIKGLEEAAKDPDVMIFHAGTKREDNRTLATGGRVLNVTALGDTLAEARDKAYAAIDKIDWPEGFYRSDIGWRALSREES